MTMVRKALLTWEVLGWVLLLIVVLPSMVFYVWKEWNFDDRPPITSFKYVEVLNSPVVAGQNLEARVWRDKVRDDCVVTVLRTAVDQDGRTWDIEDALQIKGGSVSSPFHDVSYYIPSFLPAGQYDLLVRLIYNCPGDLSFTYDQPNARFRVIGR